MCDNFLWKITNIDEPKKWKLRDMNQYTNIHIQNLFSWFSNDLILWDKFKKNKNLILLLKSTSNQFTSKKPIINI